MTRFLLTKIKSNQTCDICEVKIKPIFLVPSFVLGHL